jgi:flagellar protein FlaG
MQIQATMPIVKAGASDLAGERVVKGQASPKLISQATVGSAAFEKALNELSQAIQPFNISLKFSRDEETGKIVIQMIDSRSGDTVQQIPDEALLHVSAILGKLQGKIFSCKA